MAGEAWLTGSVGDGIDACGAGCKLLNRVLPGSSILADGEVTTGAATPPAGVLTLGPGDAVVERRSSEAPFDPVAHAYRAGAEGAVVLVTRVLGADEGRGDLSDACDPSPLSGRCTKRSTPPP